MGIPPFLYLPQVCLLNFNLTTELGNIKVIEPTRFYRGAQVRPRMLSALNHKRSKHLHQLLPEQLSKEKSSLLPPLLIHEHTL